jgi:hypothetical protein
MEENSRAFLFLVDPFTATEATILISIASVLSVFTVLSNATVIYFTKTSAELKPMGPLRALIGSMACADLLVGLIIMPLSCQLSVMKKWVLGSLGCKVRITEYCFVIILNGNHCGIACKYSAAHAFKVRTQKSQTLN